MARNTRKTSKPNGRKLSKTKGNKKTMKKQKGGGTLVIDLYAENGLQKTPTPVDTIQEIFKIIDTNMSNFNGRILDLEKEVRVLLRQFE